MSTTLRVAALVGLLVMTAIGAGAQEERSQADPTAAWWYTGVSEAEVNQLLNANGARLVSLKVQQTSPMRFTVSMVANQGRYAKTWYWYYGQSGAALGATLGALNARIIDLEPYFAGGELRFASILVANAGAENKAWWWYPSVSSQEIGALLTQNNARLVDIGTYVLNGQRRYSLVMIRNTGADQKAWWWYTGVRPGDLNTYLRNNGARLIALEDQFDGTYAAIMERCPCPAWWFYYGLDFDGVGATLAQNGARLVSIQPYLSNPGLQLRFNVVMIDNSNAATARIRGRLQAATSAPTGLYVKRIGGPVLAALQERFVFEPASTAKALIHLRALRDVQAGSRQLTDQVTRYVFTAANTSCPSNANAQAQGTEPLSTALREMMRRSDNPRTREALETVGAQAVNDLASAIGMVDSRVNQILFGCGAPPFNRLTLVDIGRLYEGVANGTLLSGTSRDSFYSLMAGTEMLADEGFDFPGMQQEIVRIVDEEAPFGLNAAAKQAFLGQLRQNTKAGGYSCITSDCLFYTSIAGWAQIPFCSGTTVVPQGYVFGLFVDGADTQAEVDAGYGVRGELLREPLRAALGNWAACAATPTRPPTPTPTPPPTATPMPPPPCSGDCSGDGTVTVDELITLVRIALNLVEPSTCAAGDTNGDGAIDITELIGAVGRTLDGCEPPVAPR